MRRICIIFEQISAAGAAPPHDALVGSRASRAPFPSDPTILFRTGTKDRPSAAALSSASLFSARRRRAYACARRLGLSSCPCSSPAARLAGARPAGALRRGHAGGDHRRDIRDYATMPITGRSTARGNRRLARARQLAARGTGRREPASSSTTSTVRSTSSTRPDEDVHDLSRFQRPRGRTGLFHSFAVEAGYANGLISLQFDPDYRAQRQVLHGAHRRSGGAGSAVPDNTSVPGLNVARLHVDRADRDARARSQREGVLIEWTDTNTRTRRSRARRAS